MNSEMNFCRENNVDKHEIELIVIFVNPSDAFKHCVSLTRVSLLSIENGDKTVVPISTGARYPKI